MPIQLDDCAVPATELNSGSFMHLARYIANIPTQTYGDAPHQTSEDHRFWVEDLFDPDKRRQIVKNLPNISEAEAEALWEIFCHVFSLRGMPEQSSQAVSMWRYCYDAISKRVAMERTSGQIDLASQVLPMLPDERDDIFEKPEDFSEQEKDDKLWEIAGEIKAIRMLISSVPGISAQQNFMAESGY